VLAAATIRFPPGKECLGIRTRDQDQQTRALHFVQRDNNGMAD
jgi:hypothetical protein